jgi:hypothetical protein
MLISKSAMKYADLATVIIHQVNLIPVHLKKTNHTIQN